MPQKIMAKNNRVIFLAVSSHIVCERERVVSGRFFVVSLIGVQMRYLPVLFCILFLIIKGLNSTAY